MNLGVPIFKHFRVYLTFNALTSVVRRQQSMPNRSWTLTVIVVLKGSSPDAYECQV